MFYIFKTYKRLNVWEREAGRLEETTGIIVSGRPSTSAGLRQTELR